jgi:hypothetical protein
MVPPRTEAGHLYVHERELKESRSTHYKIRVSARKYYQIMAVSGTYASVGIAVLALAKKNNTACIALETIIQSVPPE